MFGYAVVHVSNYTVPQSVVINAYYDLSFDKFLDFCNENAISYKISLFFDIPDVYTREHVDNYMFTVKVKSYGM